MTATETRKYSVIGLTLDVDGAELLIAAVVAGTHCRPDRAAGYPRGGLHPGVDPDLAYAFCRDFGYAEEGTAGVYL